jgi:hypothetical protein
MMDILLQQIAIGVIIVAAVAYLAVRFIRRRRRERACARCGLMKLARNTEKTAESR